MSQRTLTLEEEISLEAACDSCGANFGQWCMTRAGEPAARLHARRTYMFNQGYMNGALDTSDDIYEEIRAMSTERLLEFHRGLKCGKPVWKA